MAKEETITPFGEPTVREGLVYHIYHGIIPVYQGTWQVQEIQDDGTVLSFRCQPTMTSPFKRGALIVNSSIQFRHQLDRLDAALSKYSRLLKSGDHVRTSKNMHDPIYITDGSNSLGAVRTATIPTTLPTTPNVVEYVQGQTIEPQDLTERREVLSGTELPPSPTPSENKETPDE